MTKSDFFKKVSSLSPLHESVHVFDNAVFLNREGEYVEQVVRCKTEEKAKSELYKFERWLKEWRDENVNTQPAPEAIEPGHHVAKVESVSVADNKVKMDYKIGDKLINSVIQVTKIKKTKSLEKQFIRAAKVFFKKNKINDSKFPDGSVFMGVKSAKDFGLICLNILIARKAQDIGMEAYLRNYHNYYREELNYSFHKFMSYRKNWFDGLAREEIELTWHKNYAMENIIEFACQDN